MFQSKFIPLFLNNMYLLLLLSLGTPSFQEKFHDVAESEVKYWNPGSQTSLLVSSIAMVNYLTSPNSNFSQLLSPYNNP